MDNKLIFVDADGTLLDGLDDVSPAVVAACRAARQNGHQLFLATGRNPAEAALIRNLIDFDGAICSAGAYIEVGGQALGHAFFPTELLAVIIDFMQARSIPFYLEGFERTYISPASAAYMQNTKLIDVAPELANLSICDVLINLTPTDTLLRNNILKICYLAATDADLAALCAQCGEGLTVLPNTIRSFGPGSGELIQQGLDKGSAIERVLAHLGRQAADAVAIGDSGNDLSMLALAGTSVAMGNATEQAKAAADFVTLDVYNDGVKAALQQLGLI